MMYVCFKDSRILMSRAFLIYLTKINLWRNVNKILSKSHEPETVTLAEILFNDLPTNTDNSRKIIKRSKYVIKSVSWMRRLDFKNGQDITSTDLISQKPIPKLCPVDLAMVANDAGVNGYSLLVIGREWGKRSVIEMLSHLNKIGWRGGGIIWPEP